MASIFVSGGTPEMGCRSRRYANYHKFNFSFLGVFSVEAKPRNIACFTREKSHQNNKCCGDWLNFSEFSGHKCRKPTRLAQKEE